MRRIATFLAVAALIAAAGWGMKPGTAEATGDKVAHGFAGLKYHDENGNGKWDWGEDGLKDWGIQISDGKTTTSVKTDANGLWWYTTPLRTKAAGTTTYTIKEVQQSGWT